MPGSRPLTAPQPAHRASRRAKRFSSSSRSRPLPRRRPRLPGKRLPRSNPPVTPRPRVMGTMAYAVPCRQTGAVQPPTVTAGTHRRARRPRHPPSPRRSRPATSLPRIRGTTVAVPGRVRVLTLHPTEVTVRIPQEVVAAMAATTATAPVATAAPLLPRARPAPRPPTPPTEHVPPRGPGPGPRAQGGGIARRRCSALDGSLGHACHDPALGEQVDDDRGRHGHEV